MIATLAGLATMIPQVAGPLSSLTGSIGGISKMFGSGDGGADASVTSSAANSNSSFAPVTYNAGLGMDDDSIGYIMIGVALLIIVTIFGKKKKRKKG